jgi:protein gp37
MYSLDRKNGRNGADIYRTKAGFRYPLQKDKAGNYKIKSGEMIRVCMSSDFFLEEADEWREEAWQIMKRRSDVKFFLLTKRPERVKAHLPKNWGDGWENIFFNVTCENQKRADERLPILMELPFKHKGVMCAPFIGEVHMEQYLATGQIEQVLCGGENYESPRLCNYDWVKSLRNQCEKENVSFCFVETGTEFYKDGRRYHIARKLTQSEMAYKSGINFIGKPQHFILKDEYGRVLSDEQLYRPHYRENCRICGMRQICNGCSDCGKCNGAIIELNV